LQITQIVLHLMKEGPAPLLPLLRSRLQAEILTAVLLSPDREWSLTDLAGLVGASVATAQREIQRAEEAGIVVSRKVGNTRLVRAQPDGVLTAPLTELLLRSFGPKQILTTALRGVKGIVAAYLFGSWAARYAGNRGAAPHDLDVLVIGEPNFDELHERAVTAERRLARPVRTITRPRGWWESGDDSFHREVTRGPLVLLFGPQDTEGS
jgi:predicted nucleotidyltransferase